MSKRKSMHLLMLGILFFLSGKVKSTPNEILDKYSSVKTKNNYVFLNITDFKYEESIYLAIKSEYKCEDYISYQFLDDINDIDNKLESKFTVRPDFKFKKDIFFSKKFFTSFYTIIKSSDLIFNLKDDIEGNFLYLGFKCIGEFEIINTKTRYENIYSNLLLYFVLILMLIFIFLILKAFVSSILIILNNKSDNMIRNWAIQNTIDNISYINKIQTNMNYPEGRIVYVDISQDWLDMNQNNNQNFNERNGYFPQYNRNNNYITNNNYYIKPMNNQNFHQIGSSDYPKIQSVLNTAN